MKSSRPRPLKFRLIDATSPAKCQSAVYKELGRLRLSRSCSQKSHAKKPLSTRANWEKFSWSRLHLISFGTVKLRSIRLKDVVASPPGMPFPTDCVIGLDMRR